MRLGALLAQTRVNLRANMGSLLLSSVGIIVGIGALVFFIALGGGMKSIVLERIFVVDHLEVVPRSYDVGFLKLSGVGGLNRALDDKAVEKLRAIEGVQAVYPKLRFAFKAMAWTAEEFLGRKFYFEMFGDGIDPQLVPEVASRADNPFTDRSRCDENGACGPGLTCEEGRCLGPTCDPRGDAFCPPTMHCLADTSRCEPDIPVLVSQHLLELYNGSVSRAFGFPQISEDTMVGLYGTMRLGKSFAGRNAGTQVRERWLRVVGVSPKAITFGATLPISYVREFNSWYGKKDGGYDSVVVKVKSNEAVPAVVEAIQDEDGTRGLGFELAPRSKEALRAGVMINVLTLIFSLISLVIVGLSAIHIAHTFFMILSERRAEIGLLRAVGASRGDVRRLVLLESAIIGLVGGLGGWIAGTASCFVLDFISSQYLPAFPYKPETYFEHSASGLLIALGVAVVFCLVGAWLPARRASNMDPAAALTGR